MPVKNGVVSTLTRFGLLIRSAKRVHLLSGRWRKVVGTKKVLHCITESGQATAEYGVVILIAVALGMAVLMLFTGGAFNSLLSGLIKGVLNLATSSIHT